MRPNNINSTNDFYPKLSQIAILDEKVSSMFLNLIPRNIIIVSNFLAGPKIIISDKNVTQKYQFG